MTIEGQFFAGDGPPPPSESDAGEPRADGSWSMMPLPSLGLLLRSGLRALRRFPGLVLATYLVQLGLSAGAALIMMMLLWGTFGHRPLFDQAMAGDLAALISSFSAEPDLLVSLFSIGAAAVLIYGAVSWFLTAGLAAVFLDAPSGWREVVRWFGAVGATRFFPFLRLSLWTALPYALVLVSAGSGAASVYDRLAVAGDLGDVAGAIALGLGPALLFHWLVATAVDYARIDLVRHPGMSSARALLRGFRLIAVHPLALVHTFVFAIMFVGTMALHAWITWGQAISGLFALVAVRQLSSLLRFAAHVALLAGQVELACAAMKTPLGRRS